MRINAIVGVLTVVCACSSSSGTPVAESDAGDGGGGAAEDVPVAPVCSNKPQSNNAGSCTNLGIAPEDAGEAGVAPPVWCIEYTGSGLVPSGTALSCKTMVGDFSTSTCATVNADAVVAGYCIRSCSTPQEYVQYYYMGSGSVDAKSQCQALTGEVWVPQ
jgi:hypothetical protein